MTASTAGATLVFETLNFSGDLATPIALNGVDVAARYRLTVLEGTARVCCAHRPDECVTLHVRDGADRWIVRDVRNDTR